MAHFEITHRENYCSVRLYDKHPDRYVASFQVEVFWNKGHVHSLNGEKFYRLFPSMAAQIFRDLEIVAIRFEMMPDHLVVFERLLGSTLNIKKVRDIVSEGRSMIEIEATLKSQGDKDVGTPNNAIDAEETI